MPESQVILVALASVFVLGIGAQWLAWRIRLPSILLLLSFGFLIGPVAREFLPGAFALDPDSLFGKLLFPLVSLSVGIILFEGGLSLDYRELHEIGRPLVMLLLVGSLVTWGLATLAGVVFLRLSWSIALLLGSILVVTGPTVVGPLLSYIRPEGKVASLAKWEGIVIDPIGAILAVLVFEALPLIESGFDRHALGHSLLVLTKTFGVGTLLGFLAAALLVIPLRRYWIPDHLHSPVVLMVVVGVFSLGNVVEHEAGLVAVTVLGVLMGNQRYVTINHIVEFKENLSILLLSGLFILLAARVRVDDLTRLGFSTFAFVGFLMLVARPVSVFLGTMGGGLNWREKTFLSWLAPRGIVAASVASVFALRLESLGGPLAEQSGLLVPATFLVIVCTVAIYGLTASHLARGLGLASANPQGILIASAHAGARAVAHAVQEAGFRVHLIDTNVSHVMSAKVEGLPCTHGSALSEEAVESMDLGGIGRFLSLTSNDEVNSLAALHFSEFFGRANVYQLPPAPKKGRTETTSHLVGGRALFGPEVTYHYLDTRFEMGATVKRTKITEEFSYEAFLQHHGENSVPLFVITEDKKLLIVTAENPVVPKAGQTIISLVYGESNDEEDNAEMSEASSPEEGA